MGAEPWPGLFGLFYAGQEAIFVIQRDHDSPATSTEISCSVCVKSLVAFADRLLQQTNQPQ